MAILSRMFRLCRADLHGVMDQLEDKELLLKQYLREMEENLSQKTARLEQLDNRCRKISRDLEQRRTENAKLEKDLDLAVRRGKDDIGRMLIRKRWTLQMACEQTERQLQVIEEEKERLTDTLADQRLQYDQLKVKAAAFHHEAEQSGFEMEGLGAEDGVKWQAPSEEEVELELLQRKEALQQGGAS